MTIQYAVIRYIIQTYDHVKLKARLLSCIVGIEVINKNGKRTDPWGLLYLHF